MIFCMMFSGAYGQEDTWLSKADFGGGVRHAAIGFSIGSKGYIGTGAGVSGNNAVLKNDLWEYDQASDSWSQKANFPGGVRYYATGLNIGNKGYVGMGYADFNADKKNDFWEYDPIMNTWTRKADFAGTPRVYSACFSIGNKGYVGTGTPNDGGPIKKDFWEYDPVTNIWTQKADFGGVARYTATGLSIGNKGYIGIGQTALIFLKDFWEYNPSTNTWTQKTDFGADARYLATGFGISNRGFIGLGSTVGINGGTLKDDIWEYDPLVNTWTQRANYSGGIRESSVGFNIGNKGYIGAGISGAMINPSVSDFWEYTPVEIDNNDVQVNVPGISNPWLAGMPDGTQAAIGDAAPANSPVLVNINLKPGSWIEVSNVTGGVSHGFYPLVGSDGCQNAIECQFESFIISHDFGAEYGKSNLTAPINSLVGVFLDNNIPVAPAPPALDFTNPASRDYTELHPLLKQIFFIGDGKTSGEIQQKIFIPANATRLFLGTMDGIEWNNNNGLFTATVNIFNNSIGNRCGNNNEKMLICHKGKTLCISASAVPAHLNHGDKAGTCIVADKNTKNNSVIDQPQPLQFRVSSYPNPVNNIVHIQYLLPYMGDVVVNVFDATGKHISSQLSSNRTAGIYFYELNTNGLSKGLYYYHVQFKAGSKVLQQNGKMIIK